MFITLEGGEGTGKSTQAPRLGRRLAAAGYSVQLTREPGGTPLADGIRALLLHPDASLQVLAEAGLSPVQEAEPMLPETELLLYSAARAQHVALIREWLATGAVVISDRYADATRAYQGAARGLPVADVDAAERLATGGLVPDLILLFDLPVEEGQMRRRKSGSGGGEWNRLDAENLDFHRRVRQAYLTMASLERSRWVVLDASLPPDELETETWEVVKDRLALLQRPETS
jgi:dTMP kinase